MDEWRTRRILLRSPRMRYMKMLDSTASNRVSPFVGLLLSLSFFSAAAAHVALLYPVGGETFMPGSQVTVEWQVMISHGPANWDLYFSSDGGATWTTIQADIPSAQLSYLWIIPDDETVEGRIKVVQDNADLDYESSSGDFVIGSMSTSIDQPAETPRFVSLTANYPNPFSGETVLEYVLNHPGHVMLEVFDVRGYRVAVLEDRPRPIGVHRLTWAPGSLAGGLYVYRITARGHTESKTVLLLK